jgi:hypothetical protein
LIVRVFAPSLIYISLNYFKLLMFLTFYSVSSFSLAWLNDGEGNGNSVVVGYKVCVGSRDPDLICLETSVSCIGNILYPLDTIYL